MPWPHTFSNGDELQSYRALRSLWAATYERVKAVSGGYRWPQPNFAWPNGGGPITEIDADANLVTAASQNWLAIPPGASGASDPVPRWTNWQPVDPEFDWMPANYDVVLNPDDPDITRHVHLQIASNTQTTLTVNSGQAIKNYVTAGYLPSVEWLVGKGLAIIKRGGLWWGERWPRQPNDEERMRGGGDVARTLVTLGGDGWAAGAYAGKTLQFGPADAPTLSLGIAAVVGDAQAVEWSGDAAIAVGAAARILDGADIVAAGTVTAVEDALTSTITRFTPGESSDEELMIYAGDALQRIPVLRYAADSIVFARRDAEVGGDWCVVAAGSRAWPGAPRDTIGRFYGGASRRYATHRGTDLIYQEGVAGVEMPLATVSWSTGGYVPGGGLVCAIASHDAFDKDVWSDVQELCSEADRCYSPDLYKTLRQLQVEIEGLCVAFVPPVTYDGATRLLNYSVASLFKFAEIGYSATLTATAVSETPEFGNTGVATFAVGDEPGGVHFDLVRVSNGQRKDQGFVYPVGGVLTFGRLANDADYELVIARGWTRWVPRKFAHAYPRSGFIPDVETTDFGERFAVVPGTHEYPGQWVDRPPSAGAKVPDPFGYMVEGAAFEAGQRYRYAGDDWGDPAVLPRLAVADADPETPYWRNLWHGAFRRDVRPAYEAMRRGDVLYGGKTWLMASEARWYAGPIGAGLIGTISGTATSGDATTLVDATRYVEDEETGELSMDGRWGQFGRWVGNVLEVTRTVDDADGDPVTVVTRTPITGQPGAADDESLPTITFAPVGAYAIPEVPAAGESPRVPAIEVPALMVEAGTAYAIREPATRRNWWRGRTLRITLAGGGEAIERTITHSDDRCLWWEGDVEADLAGATFEIVELQVGAVYEWDGSKWVEPSNPKGLPLPNLLEKIDVHYGRMNNGDALAPIMPELYRALNALAWTRKGPGWTSRADPATAELNAASWPQYDAVFNPWEPAYGLFDGSIFGNYGTPRAVWDADYAAYKAAFMDADWAYEDPDGYRVEDPTPVPHNEYAIRSRLYGYNEGGSGPSINSSTKTGGAASEYGYLKVEGVPTLMASEVDFYYFATIDPADHDEATLLVSTEPMEGDAVVWTSSTYKFEPASSGATWRRWNLVSSAAVDEDGKAISAKVGNTGDLATEVLPDSLPYPEHIDDIGAMKNGVIQEYVGGWYAYANAAVVRWDVPGGFEFVAT